MEGMQPRRRIPRTNPADAYQRTQSGQERTQPTHTKGRSQAKDEPSRRIPKDAVRPRTSPADAYQRTQSGQVRTQPTHTKGRNQAKDEPSRRIPKDTIRPRTNPADAY